MPEKSAPDLSVYQDPAGSLFGPFAERRRHPRVDLDCDARIVAPRYSGPCRLIDLSAGGVRLEADGHLHLGDPVALQVPGIGAMRGRILRFQDGAACVQFALTRTQQDRLATRLTALLAVMDNARSSRAAAQAEEAED